MLYQLSDDGGSDTLETLQMLAYLHAHGKPMRRVGHKVLQIGKRCMKHYYNDEDGEGDKTFKTHPESCHTTMKDSRVHTQCCEEGDGANAKAAPTLNDQKVHVPADVNTRTIAFHVQSLFLSPPPRGTFKIYGNVGMIRRDALWFARYKPDGSYPLYRTGKTAYGGPRKAQRCKGGVLDAVAPNPMPAWVEAALDDLSKRHGLPELNHVVLHRYIDGSDTIGDHHDKWLDIHPKIHHRELVDRSGTSFPPRVADIFGERWRCYADPVRAQSCREAWSAKTKTRWTTLLYHRTEHPHLQRRRDTLCSCMKKHKKNFEH